MRAGAIRIVAILVLLVAGIGGGVASFADHQRETVRLSNQRLVAMTDDLESDRQRIGEQDRASRATRRVTETEAKASGQKFEKGMFPWMASGRSLALNRDEGFTKLLFDPETHRVVGGGIVGTNAGDLISEVAHAIEMGSTAADIGLTVHPHPTLSETVAFAAEAYEGTLTDLFIPRK